MIPATKSPRSGVTHLSMEATIDHLDDRFSPERGAGMPNERRRVLACRQCNQDRGRLSQAAQPIEALHARSHRGRQ